MSYRKMACQVCFLFSFLPIAAAAAANPPDADVRVLNERVDALQRQLEVQRQTDEKELEQIFAEVDKRFEAANRTTDQIFWLLTAFGALGGLFAYTSWSKDRKDQQPVLSEQIASISKLRDVIELVGQSFKLQAKRETDLASVTKIVQDFNRHYKETYATVRDRTKSLLTIKRMQWPMLSVFQATLAADARADFRAIPSQVLDEEKQAEPYEFARTCQLLGASAFYANDIAFAEKLLQRARDCYKSLPAHVDHRDPMAASFYFLGLISKSWLKETAHLEDGLADAVNYFEEANALLKDKAGEFLVPITLGETECQVESKRGSAAERIERKINELRNLSGKDENQKKLLVRALILLGNVRNDLDCYREALNIDEKNPYARLSLALASQEKAERTAEFKSGLEALKAAKLLDKPEVTTRATAIVWAAIAAHELGDTLGEQQYRTALDGLQSQAISTGGRVPLFFCPLTRTLCFFDTLKQNLSKYLEPEKAQAAA